MIIVPRVHVRKAGSGGFGCGAAEGAPEEGERLGAGRGLAGIECLYTGYLPNQVEEYVGLAREFGLVVTGGTDFHGDNKPGIRIGVAYGRLRVSVSAFDALEARCAAARQHPTAG